MHVTNRPAALGLVLIVFGLGIGAGLVIASVVVGIETPAASLLSSIGTGTIAAGVLLVVVLSVTARRRQPRA